MKEQLEQRLIALETEYEAGQKMLADLAAREGTLRETLLRISGAIQVLKEELDQSQSSLPDNNLVSITENGAPETTEWENIPVD